MTIGNKGYGLFKYARVVPDSGHARYVMAFARDYLSRAVSAPLESEKARTFFTERLTEAIAALGDVAKPDESALNPSPLGNSSEETEPPMVFEALSVRESVERTGRASHRSSGSHDASVDAAPN